MVFASLKNKLVSVAGTIINHVSSAVSATIVKTAEDVLPTPCFKSYGFLEDAYHDKFQLAKDEGFCIVEELGKIPIPTTYNSNANFSSIAEAKAAMAADLRRARRSVMDGYYDSPQLYRNMSPYQQMLADQHADERNFDFVDYPDFPWDEAGIAKQPTQEDNPNFNKNIAFKLLKAKLRRRLSKNFEIKPSMDLCNLYIKGIQPGMSSTDLFNLFKPFGRIISAKVMPQDKGKRGFGFVSFSKSVEAAHAILSMNHTDDMVVRFHEPKVPRKEHNFDQQLAYLSDSELAMHFYTRPLDSNTKMMPLATTTNKSTYMSTAGMTAATVATAAPAAAIPYYYYPHPSSLYYPHHHHHHHQHHPAMYALHASLQPPPLTQDQYILMKLLDMLNYIKVDMSNQERDIVQHQLTQLDLNEQYACINNVDYFEQKIFNMLAVYSDSHGTK
ncbi:hypothetical protein MBANPS3_005223 [Mucor bainieri]